MRAIIDSEISSKIARLQNDLVAQKAAFESGYWDIGATITKAEQELEQLRMSAAWYSATVKQVLSLVDDQPSKLSVKLRRGRPEPDDEEYHESASELLSRLQRSHGDLSTRLRTWTKLLVERGQLTPEQLKTLDLKAPVSEAYEQERQKERQERQTFQGGVDKLLASVEQYKPGYKREALAIYNRNHNHYSRDEKGLLMFAKHLGDEGLLPIRDRFVNSAAELFQKLKKARLP